MNSRNLTFQKIADFLTGLIMLFCMFVLGSSLTGCSNWQGAEFRIGIGSYNGAQETRTYAAEDSKIKQVKY